MCREGGGLSPSSGEQEAALGKVRAQQEPDCGEIRAAPHPAHPWHSPCAGHSTQPPGQILGKIKCWHQIHKRVAVPEAQQLDLQ